ncbi:MAG: PadR family transcriptional regulator [archaeon]
MMRGYLKTLTLKALEESPKTGYALIKVIHKHTGRKPSFGSIYPLLENLLKCGCVTVKEKDNKKTYSMTTQGKKELKDLLNKKNLMLESLEEGMKVFETMCDEKHLEAINVQRRALQMMKEGKINMEEGPHEMLELKSILIKMMVEGKIKSHEQEISKILKRTNSELKKLK